MYSQPIIDRTIDRYRAANLKLTPLPVETCREYAAKLTFKLSNTPAGQDGVRQPVIWTPVEKEFMLSEALLCKADFRYFADRYAYAELDASEGGRVAPVTFWPSQLRTLEIIAAREQENWANFDKYGFASGIHVVWHKSRQQGATALAALMVMHRMITTKHTRAITASLDNPKVHELYVRHKVVLDNLPFYLTPKIEFDVKDSHISFETLRSRITYQQANQEAGVGTGQQFDISHMTEVALWPLAERLQFDFLPAVPQHPNVFVGFESTANGKGGFWYDFTENIRKKSRGYEQWVYSFTPWYINHNKNRLVPPANWTPSPTTLEQAAIVERTSYEFAGKTIRPTLPQLYWWETEYFLNRQQGTLHIFFSNYPTTPEQSFQYATATALPVETMEWMRSIADHRKFKPYNIEYAHPTS